MRNTSVKLIPGIALTLFATFSLFCSCSGDHEKNANATQVKLPIDTPDQDRFIKVNLVQGEFTEPTEMTILPNLDILVAQRRGELMIYKNQTKKLKKAAQLNVYFKASVPDVNAEEGLLGITADPEFTVNRYIYLFYSPMGKSVNRLSRFKLVDDVLSLSSEKVILEFYSQREICCHTGGSLAFGPDGLLYISTGDNSTPFDVPKQQFVNKGYAPLDNRKGLEQYDSRRSAGNSNDLRGKILRIKVNDDATYSIPEGNLFEPDAGKSRPEIYVMGNRNPYRISVDQKTGFLYWGEVGPDASNDDELRGPRGYDEVNQARKAGNFGWPYFIGNNYAYRAYDYKTGASGSPFDPAGPDNNSPNNTGLNTLPAVQPAFIWYPYDTSKEFPQVGSGGRTAMVGPVYYSRPAAAPYPAYYNGKLIIYDWVRGWVKAVDMSAAGDYKSMEPFLSKMSLSAPMDMELGPDGKLYILEYGKGWFTKNPDAGISRIDYLKGNRPPVIAQFEIQKTSGLLPFKLLARIKATDADGGKLTYLWNLGNGVKKITTVPELAYTFTKAGEYRISVEVQDPEKSKAKSTAIPVFAGNEQPVVRIALSGNKSFYFPGTAVNYQVLVSDKGTTVNQDRIYVSSSYIEGTDLAGADLGHQTALQTLAGKSLMQGSDCGTCHKISSMSIGPAFEKIAAKYQKESQAVSYLSSKVIKGSSGVWGEVPMPAHAAMKESDVKQIVEWVMSLSEKDQTEKTLPASGKIIAKAAEKGKNPVLRLKASYTDLGAKGLKPLSTTQMYDLKSNQINLAEVKEFSGLSYKDNEGFTFLKNAAWLKLKHIDLTGVKAIGLDFSALREATTGTIEIRLDSPGGKGIGQSGFKKPAVQIVPVADAKFHDVYLIFKSTLPGIKNKMVLKNIRMEAK